MILLLIVASQEKILCLIIDRDESVYHNACYGTFEDSLRGLARERGDSRVSAVAPRLRRPAAAPEAGSE